MGWADNKKIVEMFSLAAETAAAAASTLSQNCSRSSFLPMLLPSFHNVYAVRSTWTLNANTYYARSRRCVLA